MTKMPDNKHLIHFINGNVLQPPFPENSESAVFGMGCFWGAEKLFWPLAGVFSTAAGYGG
ncbi:MAG: peptide-methionine (S)-S-oxide reductase, partial [Proteobacteria bacterium]|nr:peptide-methionine (S)-S-oxide reductase [Pseudomonadota bacterium]